MPQTTAIPIANSILYITSFTSATSPNTNSVPAVITPDHISTPNTNPKRVSENALIRTCNFILIVEIIPTTPKRNRRPRFGSDVLYWLRGSDSNRRPPGYEPDELPLLHPAMDSTEPERHIPQTMKHRTDR